ncbi:hypothetical protein HPB52_009733 [Rhipicephalus sanguineus]|uniref:Endonuclease/exonuclease/phosphatase domain-containing protein n=1 Tax=Rhipicephalus sanguineus TaxID=34632 RepID=A0A9D4T992_RHISA|nr:hypothetical protein HPB52_009733 [Rhipicephalus sanguineus]
MQYDCKICNLPHETAGKDCKRKLKAAPPPFHVRNQRLKPQQQQRSKLSWSVDSDSDFPHILSGTTSDSVSCTQRGRSTSRGSPPRESLASFDALLREVKKYAKGHTLLVVGDFNAYHTAWGYHKMDKKGTNVHDTAQHQQLTLWTDPHTPTRIGNSVSRDTNPDLTFTAGISQVEWTRLEETLGSDHHLQRRRPPAIRGVQAALLAVVRNAYNVTVEGRTERKTGRPRVVFREGEDVSFPCVLHPTSRDAPSRLRKAHVACALDGYQFQRDAAFLDGEAASTPTQFHTVLYEA